MIKRTITILLVLFLGIALLTGCDEDKDATNPTSDEAPAAAVFTDVALTAEDYAKNTLTMVNIWGTWCPPCVKELPELQELSEAYKDKGVEIIGVLQDGIKKVGEPDDSVIKSANTLLRDAGVTYRVILPDEYLQKEFIEYMQYFPTTFFFNSAGEVINTVAGANDYEGWSKLIDETLTSLEG